MTHSQILLKNGLAALLVALLCGFGLVFAMIQAISLSPLPIFLDVKIPGTAEGWRMVHLGMLMNGLMAIVMGLSLKHFQLARRPSAIVTYGTTVAVWGNFMFYLFGMFAPNHGLTLQDNSLGAANLAGVLAFVPAFIGALTLIGAVIVLLKAKPASQS